MAQFLSYYKLPFADEKPHLMVAISVIIINKIKRKWDEAEYTAWWK